MRISTTSLLACGLLLGSGLSALRAQDAEPSPSPTPRVFAPPGPAPYNLDLPDTHPTPTPPPQNLFPSTAKFGPDGELVGNPNRGARALLGESAQGNPNGDGRRHSNHNSAGNHARNGRANDQTMELADADPLEVRVSYRRAKTTAMQSDPGLAELLHDADLSPTDVGKRAFLRQYYVRLFASVARIDPSPAMKSHIFLLQLIARQRYSPQRRTVAGDEDLINGRNNRRSRH